jgi:hypothetical protein
MGGLLSFGTSDEQEQPVVAEAAPAPSPVAAASTDTLCRNVAQQDATAQSFDPQTQQKVALQSYAQCRALFNR